MLISEISLFSFQDVQENGGVLKLLDNANNSVLKAKKTAESAASRPFIALQGNIYDSLISGYQFHRRTTSHFTPGIIA